MLRLALAIASSLNIAAGLGISFLYFRFRDGGGVPVLVLVVALVLILQGAYTLGYLGDLFGRGKLAAQFFLAGEATAALVGALGFLQGILYNLSPRNGDYEFGPMTAALLIGAHAVIGLLYATTIRKSALSKGY